LRQAGGSSIKTKYAKYSTEQLEVILTHLSDPDDRELVKKELSRRYYDHYLGLIKDPEEAPQAVTAPEPEVEAAGEETSGPGDYPALAEEAAGIEELGPPRLSPPPPLETAGNLAEKTAKKKLCFIATAAFGTPLAPEVMVLQNFRDDYLAPHSLGRQCLQLYYRLSPGLAQTISRHPSLGQLTRMFLTPIIRGIKKICG
jgi:hypothetical protein